MNDQEPRLLRRIKRYREQGRHDAGQDGTAKKFSPGDHYVQALYGRLFSGEAAGKAF